MSDHIFPKSTDQSGIGVRFPIRWSGAMLTQLTKDYEQALDQPSSLRALLLKAQLEAISGRHAEAEAIVCNLAITNAKDIHAQGGGILEEVLWTLFVVQQFDLLAALLRDTASLAEHIEIRMEEGLLAFWGVEWKILSPSCSNFVFDKLILQSDNARLLFLRFVGVFPLFAEHIRQHPAEIGSTIVSLGDDDLSEGLGCSTSRVEAFLIPDYYFMIGHGYESLRRSLSQQSVPWDQRYPMALWRGSTTGDLGLPSHRWRELLRIRLCEIARSQAAIGLLDAGITEITQISDSVAIEEIKNSGYMTNYVPPVDFQRWKYQIDIDGNTYSTGLFIRLLTGSVVLKVTSLQGHRQWYYDKLSPWVNYIPIAPDLSDLVERIEWLRTHDDVARAIGYQGKLLADSLDYPSELKRASNTITAAIRCANAGCRPGGHYKVTPREVELAFRLILGRNPEGQDVICRLMASAKDLDDLRAAFFRSPEFRAKVSVLSERDV
jgi:Glycosyl transferase family 90